MCDTALATLLVKATDIILRDVDDLLAVLAAQAKAYQYTPCMGRTHGVHAEPTTLGLKFALWYADMTRCKARLLQARKTIGVGKISGAVGNFANVDPFIEKYVCESLGLAVAPISTQVLQRDRHAEFLSTLAILGGCMEKIATEIRGLQKTETREVEEPFYAGQKGSSAMPHKRNPINSEKICGLARMLRGYALVGFENIALWHERDISHSSTERITLSDATILTDCMLAQITRILKDLFVYPENMLRNFNASYHLVFSQQVLLTLIGKGLLRETAYDLVQRCAMSAWENKRDFKAVLSDEPQIQELLTPAELDGCFDVNYYMKHVSDIFQRVGIE